ncbi:MAG: hypothetical protein IKP06_02385 [Elusimicrobiaceae bacterium]|nr:hypothetical protein [Elusimicrobiaceae bacterium]
MKQTSLLPILGILALLTVPAVAQNSRGAFTGARQTVQAFTGSEMTNLTSLHDVERAVTQAAEASRHAVIALPIISSVTPAAAGIIYAEDRASFQQAQKAMAYSLLLKHKYKDNLSSLSDALQGTLTQTVERLYKDPKKLIEYLIQHDVSADALLEDVAIQYTAQNFPDKTIASKYFDAADEQLLTLLLTKYNANPNLVYKDPYTLTKQPLFFNFIEGAVADEAPSKTRANLFAFQLFYNNGGNLSLLGDRGTGYHVLIKKWPADKYAPYFQNVKNINWLRDQKGNSLLHAVADLPRPTWEQCRFLIDLGINPTLTNNAGYTAARLVMPEEVRSLPTSVILDLAPRATDPVYFRELHQRLTTAETVWKYNHPYSQN